MQGGLAGERRRGHGQPDALLVAVAHRVEDVITERVVVLATTGIVVVLAAGGRALTQTPAVEKGKVALKPKQQRHRQRHRNAGGEVAVPEAEAGPAGVGVRVAHAQMRWPRRLHRRRRELVGDEAEGEGEVPRRVATAPVKWNRPRRGGLCEHEQPRSRLRHRCVRSRSHRHRDLVGEQMEEAAIVLAAVVSLLQEVVAMAVRLPLLRLLLVAVTVMLMTEAAVMTRRTMERVVMAAVTVVAVALIAPRLEDGLELVPRLRPRVAAVAAEALADGGESESSKGEEPATQQRIDGMS